MNRNRAWHFVRGVAGKPTLRDGRTLVVGDWLEHPGKIEVCRTGLHASRRAFDALDHCDWEGGFACLVDVDGVEHEGTDKLVARRRRALFAVPCDQILRAFARKSALSVLHLWPDAPAVVREYLETGNEAIRAAARDAARDAAWDAKITELNGVLESLITDAAKAAGWIEAQEEIAPQTKGAAP